jgi:adenylate cyclase
MSQIAEPHQRIRTAQQDMSKKRLKPYLLIAAAALAAAFCLTPWGQAFDRLAYDAYFKVRGEQHLPDDIVFVAIDEISFQEIGLQWPWPRALHARLLENLYTAGAKVVAIDILFPEPSTPEDDAALAAVLGSYGTTVLAADVSRSEDNRFVVENNIQPLAELRTPLTRVGHIRTPADPDGFVRRADLELRDFQSLGYATAVAYTDGNCCEPLPASATPLINFSGGPGTANTVSYYQALDPGKYLPPDTFRNKLVVLGVNTTSSVMPEERRPDHFPTPFTRGGGGYAPGSLIHMNVIANLLQHRFITATPLPLLALLGFLLATAYGLATLRIGFIASSLLAGLLAVLLLAGSFWLFADKLTYASPTTILVPLFAAYLFSPYYRYLAEARQRAFIRKAFSTYVNPAIVAQLEQDPDSVKLGGKQVDGTALFLDIAGFTALSERHDPETLVSFINEFLSALINIAMDNGGTVERFLGDAVMVIWGAPVEQNDHAQRACETAVAMAAEIARISTAESARLGATIHARIGINSGSMTAGNIGANRRFNYTVLGDCVNLAARLEGLNKIYGTTVIVGEATRQQLDDDFVLRRLDVVTVKGRKQAEPIYELSGLRSTLDAEKSQALDAYARGLACYQQRDWDDALECFSDVLAALPGDAPSALMSQRCEQYRENPPPDDWHGVTDINEK